MEYRIVTRTLHFKKPAKTSRNIFEERLVRFVLFSQNGVTGIGEAAPLVKLSIDDIDEYDKVLHQYCHELVAGVSIQDLDLSLHPSMRFGLETALLDLQNGGQQLIFKTAFYSGSPIRINGLIWMGELDQMYEEALQKIKSGFDCIKFKIGTHDFDAECRLIEKIRKQFSAFKLEIRLDANGAFLPDEAQQQLRDLARFDIHSIEQPIGAGQWDSMAKLCRESKIGIALDEELIGLDVAGGDSMLTQIRPQYLIFKPSLIGGFTICDAWIALCHKHDIGWWATSALESNIGLNAIAQWVSQYNTSLPQGLGTGGLYTNNIESPVKTVGQELVYDKTSWDMSFLSEGTQ